MSNKKQPRIAVRIPRGSDLEARLEAAIKKTGMDAPTLVLRCVEAAVEYIEKHGEITLPLVLAPASAVKKVAPSHKKTLVRKST